MEERIPSIYRFSIPIHPTAGSSGTPTHTIHEVPFANGFMRVVALHSKEKVRVLGHAIADAPERITPTEFEVPHYELTPREKVAVRKFLVEQGVVKKNIEFGHDKLKFHDGHFEEMWTV